MANGIGKADASIINSLYANEVKKAHKTAGTYDSKEEGPTPSDAQAFKDHAELISTLEAVLREDSRNSFEPNEVTED